MGENPTQLNPGINNKELELITTAIKTTIQTLSKQYKGGNDEFLIWYKHHLNMRFHENCLRKQNHSNIKSLHLKSITAGKSVCLSLPKDLQKQNVSSRQETVTSDYNINHFMHNDEKWAIYFKDLAVFPPQDLKAMFDYFSKLCRTGLKKNLILINSKSSLEEFKALKVASFTEVKIKKMVTNISLNVLRCIKKPYSISSRSNKKVLHFLLLQKN